MSARTAGNGARSGTRRWGGALGAAMPETENPDPSPSEPDGENVLRDLRLQLETVKARMQAHRETMQAAGLAPRRRGVNRR